MPKLRLRFAKTGRSAFLSHLDVVRTFQRAFNRAELPLKHSEGFNPHPILSIAHPLPLGVSSRFEILDCETAGEYGTDTAARLNAALPEGLSVLRAYAPEAPVKEIRFVRYQMVLEYDRPVSDETAEALLAYLSSGEVTFQKKSKRGVSEARLADYVDELSVERTGQNELTGDVRLRVFDAPLSPKYLVGAIADERLVPSFSRFFRTHMLREEGTDFL